MVRHLKQAHRHGQPTAKKFNHLSLLFFCLLLTVALTIFSIWYNLKKESDNKEGLFYFIGHRFEEGFNSTNLPVNF